MDKALHAVLWVDGGRDRGGGAHACAGAAGALDRRCDSCGTTSTAQWRYGGNDEQMLCNGTLLKGKGGGARGAGREEEQAAAAPVHLHDPSMQRVPRAPPRRGRPRASDCREWVAQSRRGC